MYKKKLFILGKNEFNFIPNKMVVSLYMKYYCTLHKNSFSF